MKNDHVCKNRPSVHAGQEVERPKGGLTSCQIRCVCDDKRK